MWNTWCESLEHKVWTSTPLVRTSRTPVCLYLLSYFAISIPTYLYIQILLSLHIPLPVYPNTSISTYLHISVFAYQYIQIVIYSALYVVVYSPMRVAIYCDVYRCLHIYEYLGICSYLPYFQAMKWTFYLHI